MDNKIKTNSFVKMPTNLIFILDNNCAKMLLLLIQKESYWEEKDKLDADGFFACRHEDMVFAMKMSERDIPNVIEALYRADLIDVKSNGFTIGKRVSNRYKVKWDTIRQMEETYTIQDILEQDIEVKQCKRGEELTYLPDRVDDKVDDKVLTNSLTKCPPTIDNIDNINNIDNIKNNNILNNNIIKEKPKDEETKVDACEGYKQFFKYIKEQIERLPDEANSKAELNKRNEEIECRIKEYQQTYHDLSDTLYQSLFSYLKIMYDKANTSLRT